MNGSLLLRPRGKGLGTVSSMPLCPEHREHVLRTAVELLRHPRRPRLLKILADRLEHEERQLDRIIFALARTVDEELGEP